MGSIRIFKRWDLKGVLTDITDAAEEGIEAACAETTTWIKNDVLLDQQFLSHPQFPDVLPTTRTQKNKKGERQVLISTGHLKDSWNFEVKGLEGVVGSGSEGYFGRIYKRWKIDELWREQHADEAAKIVKKAITRKIK
jgi:hypothetical protein